MGSEHQPTPRPKIWESVHICPKCGFALNLSEIDMRTITTGNQFSNRDENSPRSDDEIVLAALDDTADEKLTGLALRVVLSDHIGIPHKSQPDLLTESEQVFASKKPKAKSEDRWFQQAEASSDNSCGKDDKKEGRLDPHRAPDSSGAALRL